jgi:hypothetical protein
MNLRLTRTRKSNFMYRHIFIFLIAAATVPAQIVPVPLAYQDTHTTVWLRKIASFDAAVRANWNGSPSGVIYAPQLETASAANYTNLLGANLLHQRCAAGAGAS